MFAWVLVVLLGVSGRIAGGETDWKQVGKASSLETVDVLLVLKREPAALAKLEKIFWETSEPRHENYGDHLTQAEVTQLMGIGDAQLNAVTGYLRKSGFAHRVDVGAHRDMVVASLGVGGAEKMFGVELFKYQHALRPRRTIIRAPKNSALHIPEELQDNVFYVDNLLGFPKLTTLPRITNWGNKTNATLAPAFPEALTCSGTGNWAVTPKVLATRYKTNGPLKASEAHGRMGVAEFQDQFWSSKQLGQFNQFCEMNASVHTQVGFNNQTECNGKYGGDCTECQLDIEYITSVAGAIPLTDVYTSSYSILDWAYTLSNMSDSVIPHVNSVSYGNDENENYQNYMEACNVEFQKLGVRGVSVMFAAGDEGVWGREGVGSEFHPDFPGASPYITAVGGTNFAVQSVIGEEEAWQNGGGGFSDIFAMPEYQKEVVTAYKNQAGLPDAALWNQGEARGYPDVSALAGLRNPYLVYTDSHFEGVGGTSAATPVFSAIIAKLNSLRLAKGGKPLGFLNPWLYQNADAFNDVTLGNNGGLKDGSGFPATAGWDAATGLGTPNFEMLSQRI